MKAQIIVNQDFVIDSVSPGIYGGFIEHLGRAVYEGIYEPGHPTADADGFRHDVIDLVRELNMPITRYPGGNFVSGYNWEDGIGPKVNRPARLDLAWKALEPNQVGTDEFMKWCRLANTAPMMAVNLGTRGPAEAQALVEYCNHPQGSYWSDLRRKNGAKKPYGVQYWCLGNEMDGVWQTGHKTAEEYGRVAAEAAKMMKWTDPSIKLIVCGSSGDEIATFGAWDAAVLEQTYPHVDYLSLHHYFGNGNHNTPDFLAGSDAMSRHIEKVIAACDFVKAKLKSDKTIMLSFDEWNVWFHSHGQEKNSPEWSVARPILEDLYTMEDALVVGSLLISLINHADRVKLACLAQTVNVIAPIMTRKNGGAWRQTIFFPFQYTSQYGRGTALRQVVDVPTYGNNTPYLTSSTIYNAETRELRIFAVNRNLEEKLDLSVPLQSFPAGKVVEHLTMHHADLNAVNTENREAVCPVKAAGTAVSGGVLKAKLPPASWNLIRVKLA